MSQQANTGKQADTASFWAPITALATSDNTQPQDSPLEEPAEYDDSEESFEEPDKSEDTGLEQDDAETDADDESAEETDSDTDPDDPEKKRFKYWQSQADKVKAENKALKKELEAFKAVPNEAVDLAKTLLEQPDVVQVVQEYLTTGKRPAAPQAQVTGAREQLKALKPPAAPQVPENYDEDDALTDPKSESAKYLRAERQYDKDLKEYLLKREQLRDLAEQEAETLREQQARQEAQTRQVRRELTAKHGLQAAEVDEFFEVVSKAPSIEDMVLYYKAKKGLLKAAAQTQQKKQELDKKAELAKKNPLPPGTRTPGAGGGKPKNDFFIRG